MHDAETRFSIDLSIQKNFFHLAKKMLTIHLSIDLEKKISFSKGVCSERTLGNEKTSTCPETLVQLKFRVGWLLIQT